MQLGDDVFETLLEQRIIVIGQVIDDELANRVIPQLLLKAAEDPEADIRLYINTQGGSVSAGLGILDTMQYVTCDVATYAMGLAAGTGQLLLSAGARGKRYALGHAQVRMVPPRPGPPGTDAELLTQAQLFLRHYHAIAAMIAEHTGQTVDRITEDWRAETWFTAHEALEYGFVDHVIGRPDPVPPRT